MAPDGNDCKAAPSPHSAHTHRPSVFLPRYVHWLDKRGGKYIVVVLWVAILVIGIVGVVQVFPSLKLSVRTRCLCVRRLVIRVTDCHTVRLVWDLQRLTPFREVQTTQH